MLFVKRMRRWRIKNFFERAMKIQVYTIFGTFLFQFCFQFFLNDSKLKKKQHKR